MGVMMDCDKNKRVGGVRSWAIHQFLDERLEKPLGSWGRRPERREDRPRFLECVVRKVFGETTAFITATEGAIGWEVL